VSLLEWKGKGTDETISATQARFRAGCQCTRYAESKEGTWRCRSASWATEELR